MNEKCPYISLISISIFYKCPFWGKKNSLVAEFESEVQTSCSVLNLFFSTTPVHYSIIFDQSIKWSHY